MEERKVKRNARKKNVNSKRVSKKSSSKQKSKKTKVKIKPILIVDYTFLVSLILSIIFGIQTNTTIFFLPFTITLVVTIVCMGIILVNAIYSKIKKIFKKVKSD